MAKYEFDRVVTGEELKGMVEKALGSGFWFAVKKNRIEIVQDAARGCIIQVREKDGRTICKGPYVYTPSVGIRIVALGLVFLWCVVILTIIRKYVSKYVGEDVIGALLIIISAVLSAFLTARIMVAPSQKLARRVGEVLEELAKK